MSERHVFAMGIIKDMFVWREEVTQSGERAVHTERGRDCTLGRGALNQRFDGFGSIKGDNTNRGRRQGTCGKRSFQEFQRVQRFKRCSSHVQENQERAARRRVVLNCPFLDIAHRRLVQSERRYGAEPRHVQAFWWVVAEGQIQAFPAYHTR